MGFHSCWVKPTYMLNNQPCIDHFPRNTMGLPHLCYFAQGKHQICPRSHGPSMVPPPPWLNRGAAVNLAATGFYSQGGVPWLFRSIGNLGQSGWKPMAIYGTRTWKSPCFFWNKILVRNLSYIPANPTCTVDRLISPRLRVGTHWTCSFWDHK